ncbi:MAG: DUF1080 domain-containing protein, partial [Planctomycetes bacterium]|nr:DUF1080 domain-containing protein [Planctomycetota bacterium]
MFALAVLLAPLACDLPAAEPSREWISLFDVRSLDGWRASEHSDTWQVVDGCLVAHGERSHLFYEGMAGDHDFRNFELVVEARTEAAANSGVYFHTRYQQSGWPEKGYEVQINNSYSGTGRYRELKRTGSLYGVRNIYKSFVGDSQWFHIRVKVVANRICIWVNDYPTVDYLEQESSPRRSGDAGRRLSHGTFALQGHDAGSQVAFRKVAVRLLPDDADPQLSNRASDEGYAVPPNRMDELAAESVPVIDFHVHLRGGMTVEKAMDRQAVTGVNV